MLLAAGERRFLVSATHVLHPTYISEIMIPNGTDLIGIEGQAWGTDLNQKFSGDVEDPVDVTIVELTSEVVAQLTGKYQFLEIQHVMIDHRQAQGHQYMIMGYPGLWTTVERSGDELKAKPLILRTGVRAGANERHPDFPKNCKWIVEYRETQNDVSTDAVVRSVDPGGLSGGGLWFIDVKEAARAGATRPLLVGINTHHSGTDQELLATRTDLVTELLRQRFGLTLPASRTIEVNLNP